MNEMLGRMFPEPPKKLDENTEENNGSSAAAGENAATAAAENKEKEPEKKPLVRKTVRDILASQTDPDGDIPFPDG